jgi:type IV pilus assembly protein PilB
MMETKIKRKLRLGEMLTKEGLITHEQLENALKEHKRHGLKLGSYLNKFGVCKERDIVRTLSRQMDIEEYSTSAFPLDMKLADIVPSNLARFHNLVPLRSQSRILFTAMTDPLDIEAIDALEFVVEMEVEPVACTEQELELLFKTLYGVYSGLDNVLESIEDISLESDGEAQREEEDLALDRLEYEAEEAPVVRLMNSILSQAVSEKASDVHISPEKELISVRFRKDGKLIEVPAPPKRLFLPLVSRIKLLSGMDISVSRVPQDGRFTLNMDRREINVRASCLPTIHGENVVLRLLDMNAGGKALRQLGLDDDNMTKILRAMQKPHGMFLATGPTGSGKSTSLYAFLREIASQDIHVVTLEDPVEYRMQGVRQVQLNHRAGMTFASGLRSILRQDPDVILVGEIRDNETARIAVQAALTGHRVLSTVHTNDAVGAVTRLVDMGVEPFLVSSVLVMAMAQRLVRKVCEECAEEFQPSQEMLEHFGIDSKTGAGFKKAVGCPSCSNTGYKDRIGIYEVLLLDDMVTDMIQHRATAGEIKRACIESGALRTLKEAVAKHLLEGVTSFDEAASAVMM